MFRFFENLIEPFPSEGNNTPPKTFFAFCLHYSKGSKRYLLLMAILNAAIATIEVSMFGFLGKLVDLLNQHTPQTLWQEASGSLLFMGGLITIVLPLVVYCHSLLLHQTLLGNYPMGIRWQAHRHLLGQSIEFYQNEFAGRIATKVMQTALSVRETIMKLLDVLLYITVYFIGILFLVISLDFRLAIPFIIWGISYVSLLVYFVPRLSEISARQADARSDMTGRIVDTYTNISTVKLFSHGKRETSYAKEGMARFLHTVYPQMRLATQLNVAVWILNCILAFAVGSLSIWLWINVSVTSGAIAAAIGLILRLFGMSQWIMWEVSALFENIGTVRDGMNTLTLPRDVQDKSVAQSLNLDQSLNNADAEINFDQGTFTYGDDAPVFDQFSLNIKAGEKIGLVGRSGAGKSTLVNLLLRFYDIQTGSISIGKQNIADVTQESLRAQIGMVTQDTSLLHRSIRENILYGRPDASDEDMIAAAKLAHAHEFIESLKDHNGNDGYDTLVGERGVKLSGGQRQRIAIARVLLKNAPILILDEATSALDSEVESQIQHSFAKLMEQKTVIAIAHRLSTIAAMDRLVVVDKGKIIEQGTHSELIQLNGIYADLWNKQSGGFLAES